MALFLMAINFKCRYVSAEFIIVLMEIEVLRWNNNLHNYDISRTANAIMQCVVEFYKL